MYLIFEGDGWSCDCEEHTGKNFFRTRDPLYGCANILEHNWGACEACVTARIAKAAEEGGGEEEEEEGDQ